jgi:alpha-ketoglutarate-dependent taurine dioxygenase
VLRTGGVTKRRYVDFARRLGSPITLSKSEFPEIAVMNNEGVDSTKTRKGAAHWHSDQSFQKHRASITMLYCAKASRSGGETRFCDLAGAYADLPDELKTRIEGLDVIHLDVLLNRCLCRT